MKAFLLVLLLSQLLQNASGHAVLGTPPARNYVAYKKCLGGVDCPAAPANCPGDGSRLVGCRDHNFCSAQAGGPGAVSGRGKKWPSPVGSHGLCGDPIQTRGEVENWEDEPYMYSTPPQATYKAGDIVEIEILVCTEHRGMYVFRICDKPLDADNFKTQKDAEECLDKWYLTRAPPSDLSPGDALPIDTKHPDRWYIPGGTTTNLFNNATPDAGPDWDSDRDFKPWMSLIGNDAASETLLQQRRLNTPTGAHKMRMIIPEGLSCTRCTMQWHWVSGNNCGYDADYNEYFDRNKLVGKSGKVCDAKFTGEEFWNCADITVNGKPVTTRRRTSRRRSGPKTTTTTTPVGPYPPGCKADCKDDNEGCKAAVCDWGDFWQNQCKLSCKKCTACVPAPATPSPTAAPSPSDDDNDDTGSKPRRRRSKPSRRRRSKPSRRRRRRATRRRRSKRVNRRRRSKDTGDNDDGSTRRRSPPSPPKGPPKAPRYDCKPSSSFNGDVAQYATKDFCKCDYGGGTGCSFICGGTKPNHGGNCGPAACSEGLVTFDAENTYIINVKLSEGKSGAPYRAFAYMKDVKVPSPTTFSWTFKSNGHSKVYSKMFFWGDGNNILGLQPPASAGGSSTFCFMPSTDAPVNLVKCNGGSMECKDDTWYRVDLKLNPPSSMTLSINGKSIGTGSIQGFTGMPMIGVYHWGGMDQDYQFRFRDMCLGESSLTNR